MLFSVVLLAFSGTVIETTQLAAVEVLLDEV